MALRITKSTLRANDTWICACVLIARAVCVDGQADTVVLFENAQHINKLLVDGGASNVVMQSYPDMPHTAVDEVFVVHMFCVAALPVRDMNVALVCVVKPLVVCILGSSEKRFTHGWRF